MLKGPSVEMEGIRFRIYFGGDSCRTCGEIGCEVCGREEPRVTP